MTEFPDNVHYTREHEWAREQNGRVIVGITDHAQDQLGDVVFVGLPEPGAEVKAGEPLGEVESTKSVSDIYSPVSGTVLEKNAEVEATPELINEDPYGRGWLVSIDAAGQLDGLLSADDYRRFVEESA